MNIIKVLFKYSTPRQALVHPFMINKRIYHNNLILFNQVNYLIQLFNCPGVIGEVQNNNFLFLFLQIYYIPNLFHKFSAFFNLVIPIYKNFIFKFFIFFYHFFYHFIKYNFILYNHCHKIYESLKHNLYLSFPSKISYYKYQH